MRSVMRHNLAGILSKFPGDIDRLRAAVGYISGWSQETITGTDSIGIFIFPDEQQNRTCPIQITFACRGFGAGGALRLPVKEIVADRIIQIHGRG